MKITGKTDSLSAPQKKIVSNEPKDPVIQGKNSPVKLDGRAKLDGTQQTKPVPVSSADMHIHNKTNLSTLLSSLKMPPDNLSRAIITFARFFSLPLEPKLLYSLRQQLMEPKIINRETAAMAAAAAADKGIKLGEKAFAEYSSALEGFIKNFTREQLDEFPVYRRLYDQAEQQSDKQQGDGSYTGSGNPEGQEPKQKEPGNKEQKKGRDTETEKAVSPVRQHITELLQKWPLLDFINRIPGKNGRWIILPFSYTSGGLEISVSMHLYIKPNVNSGTMFMDIKVNQIEQKHSLRQWQIVLKKPETKAGIMAELGIFSSTEVYTPVKLQHVRKELAKILEISPENVQIREKPSFSADLEEELLQSIDMKV